MTTPSTLRQQALDAARQAIRDGQWWLPPAGQAQLVDAVLAIAAPAEACCVCGGGPVVYRNYRQQPFCLPCSGCECGRQTGATPHVEGCPARAFAARDPQSEARP